MIPKVKLFPSLPSILPLFLVMNLGFGNTKPLKPWWDF